MMLENLFIFFFMFVESFGRIKIIFDEEYSPPKKIPDNANKIYSVPLNQVISKPIIAHLELDGDRVSETKHGKMANLQFTIETVDIRVHRNATRAVDKWKEEGGTLCQWARNVKYRIGRKEKFYCGENEYRTTLMKDLRVYDGMLIAEGLFHHHLDYRKVPVNRRIFKFTVILPNFTTVENFTNPVLIEIPAVTLEFDKDFTSSVIANHPFNISLKVLDINNKVVTTGLDSISFVQLQLVQNLTHCERKIRMLHSSDDPLTCKTFWKPATAGHVLFTDIRIIDIHPALRFTAKLLQPRFPRIAPKKYYRYLLEEFHKFLNVSDIKCYPIDIISKEFEVTAQNVSELVLLKTSKTLTRVNANSQMYPEIIMELRDPAGIRIWDGPDDDLPVITKTFPESACLSVDSNFSLKDGRGLFPGSICVPIDRVQLQFEVKTSSNITLRTEKTQDINVTDYFLIGCIYNGVRFPFIPGAVSLGHRIVKKFKVVEGRRFLVIPKNNRAKVSVATTFLKEFLSDKQIVGIIGLGGNQITEKLGLLLHFHQIPTIGLRENKHIFENKKLYPYFNRICWSTHAIIHSLFLAAVSRKWTHVVVITDEDNRPEELFFEQAEKLHIKIVAEMILPDDIRRSKVKQEMLRVKSFGVRIIFLYVAKPRITMVLREAINAGISCMDGYQWVLVESLSWQFPWDNLDFECFYKPYCTHAFQGLHSFSSTYKYYKQLYNFGLRSEPAFGGLQVESYNLLVIDAMYVFAVALHKLIENHETVTGPKLALEIRKVKVVGISGKIYFDNLGNRPGYYGYLVTVFPYQKQSVEVLFKSAVYNRMFIGVNYTHQKEIRMKAFPPLTDPPWNYFLAPVAFPNATYINKCLYHSSSGYISDGTGEILPIPPSTDAPQDVVLTEMSVAPFFCELGCGGKHLTDADINLYEFGNCTAMNKCTCNFGYYGDQCEAISCNCNHGYCEKPDVCLCEKGWTGPTCDIAICGVCLKGRCTSPGICTCDSLWAGTTCSISLQNLIIALIIVILLAGAFIAFTIQKHRKEYTKEKLQWVVKWTDLIGAEKSARQLIYSRPSLIEIAGKVAIWKSTQCFLEKFHTFSVDVNNERLLTEISQLREIKHHNVVTFVGACLESPNVCLLFELCSKGSLSDVLSNDTMPLDWDFRFSILRDICRGMSFIHKSAICSHGNLRSSNCVIDDKWTCKIAGHGCMTIRYDTPRLSDLDPVTQPSDLLWTAPELLRTASKFSEIRNGTQPGDVYSFAIIVTEVIEREQPYNFERGYIDVSEIISLVKCKDSDCNQHAKNVLTRLGIDFSCDYYRPYVDRTSLPLSEFIQQQMLELLKETWNENPKARPTFRKLLNKLNRMRPMRGNLVDNMLHMLEKYSLELEGIVAEKSKDVISEKHKTEQLISQLLPKKVAEELKYKSKVDPETFSSVTIFLSDIVDFTSIAKESTAMQVVEFLNDLYTTFDAIIDAHDVYKVETIGDAYMVASGLPVRNQNQHAGEIATMSLDLLASLYNFRIKHRPEETIYLRIGIHSGPVVAGVVGLKMPRYCLFGNTVRIAQIMEHTSESLKIHMSEDTANILTELGGYKVECRGEMEIKMKEKMTTYWLLGKEMFEKSMPVVSVSNVLPEL